MSILVNNGAGGGIIEPPDDSKLYSRQHKAAGAWAPSTISLTQEEYDELVANNLDDLDTPYFIVDANGGDSEPRTWTTTGTGSAYLLTPDPPITEYKDGQRFRVKFHTANTSTTPTINISGLGVKNLRRGGSYVLETNSLPLPVNSIWDIEYMADQNCFTLVGTDYFTIVSQVFAEAGTSAIPYWWTPQRVAQSVRGVPTTGLVTTDSSTISPTDNIVTALGKLQAQLTAPNTWKTISIASISSVYSGWDRNATISYNPVTKQAYVQGYINTNIGNQTVLFNIPADFIPRPNDIIILGNYPGYTAGGAVVPWSPNFYPDGNVRCSMAVSTTLPSIIISCSFRVTW